MTVNELIAKLQILAAQGHGEVVCVVAEASIEHGLKWNSTVTKLEYKTNEEYQDLSEPFPLLQDDVILLS